MLFKYLRLSAYLCNSYLCFDFRNFILTVLGVYQILVQRTFSGVVFVLCLCMG